MPDHHFTVTITASAIAWYAAVVASVEAGVSVANYFRERIKIKVKYQRNMEMVGDPRYRGMTLTIVEAANASKRSVTIKGMGAYGLYGYKSQIFTDTTPHLPTELTEGKYVTALVDEAGFDFEHISSFAAWDAVGRRYWCHVAPWHTRMVSRIRRRLAGSNNKTA